ncbi:unnamed protein product [Tilletia laevis]|uniref:Uncharacterized protein n=1 Tax=Tilletia caries TaxID=13290 RepID=A0ABN7J6F2_9BASI|nr:unnamed protein product [Tilletia caries]CAD6916173.1 unnamed protein product [Tilletia laevis]CAD6948948.1 unnamed protein product [Tilletia caries]CAD7062890.1 unnamed protein product [Tilletia caries]
MSFLLALFSVFISRPDWSKLLVVIQLVIVGLEERGVALMRLAETLVDLDRVMYPLPSLRSEVHWLDDIGRLRETIHHMSRRKENIGL